MKDVMGIILTGGEHETLQELTRTRLVTSLPVGGKYRIIDFILSNMVNSGIRNIGVITQSNYHSLMNHLGNGEEWDLKHKKDGLFILPPYVKENNCDWCRGNVDSLRNNLGFIRKSTQKYVIVSGSDSIYNTTFNEAMKYHMEKKADVTVLYRHENAQNICQHRKQYVLQVNHHGKITGVEYKQIESPVCNIPLRVYILEKGLLEELIEENTNLSGLAWVKNVIDRRSNDLRIYGYYYPGYCRTVNSVQSYYQANLDMLIPEIRQELFLGVGHIHTRIRDEAPAIYRKHAVINNCIVSDGTFIDGEVENSIIFSGVTIKRGTRISNCIVMQNSVIQENVELENVILDKEVHVTKGKRLVGQRGHPLVIPKQALV